MLYATVPALIHISEFVSIRVLRGCSNHQNDLRLDAAD